MNENRGCKFGGQFNVNKVPGNFHISTHSVSTKGRFSKDINNPNYVRHQLGTKCIFVTDSRFFCMYGGKQNTGDEYIVTKVKMNF